MLFLGAYFSFIRSCHSICVLFCYFASCPCFHSPQQLKATESELEQYKDYKEKYEKSETEIQKRKENEQSLKEELERKELRYFITLNPALVTCICYTIHLPARASSSFFSEVKSDWNLYLNEVSLYCTPHLWHNLCSSRINRSYNMLTAVSCIKWVTRH